MKIIILAMIFAAVSHAQLPPVPNNPNFPTFLNNLNNGTLVNGVDRTKGYSNPDFILNLDARKIFNLKFQAVAVNGLAISPSPTLNLIAGSGVSIACTPNVGTNMTDCTISLAGGSTPSLALLSNGQLSTLTNILLGTLTN